MNVHANAEIIYRYIILSILVVFSLVLLWKVAMFVFKKKNIFSDKHAKKTGNTLALDLMTRHPNRYNIAYMICTGIWIAMTIFYGTYCIPDMFSILKGEYLTAECITITGSFEELENASDGRTITCIAGKELIEFEYFGPPISTGKKIKINYYKHIRIGTIVERYDE